MMKKAYFEGKINPSTFLLTRRKQFWISFLKIVARNLQIHQNPKLMKKTFLHKQLILLKCSHGHVICGFDIIAEQVWRKAE